MMHGIYFYFAHVSGSIFFVTQFFYVQFHTLFCRLLKFSFYQRFIFGIIYILYSYIVYHAMKSFIRGISCISIIYIRQFSCDSCLCNFHHQTFIFKKYILKFAVEVASSCNRLLYKVECTNWRQSIPTKDSSLSFFLLLKVMRIHLCRYLQAFISFFKRCTSD